MRKIAFILLAAALGVHGQSSYSSITDSGTPVMLAPGSPAGSYSLTGLDSMSTYSGSLGFRLPLLQINGRGQSGYTITLPINPTKWRVELSSICSSPGCQYSASATWTHWSQLDPGYGPGVMMLRQSANMVQSCGTSSSFFVKTQSRLTFIAADGSELELRDTGTGGQEKDVNCSILGYNRGKNFVTADGSFARFVADANVFDQSYTDATPAEPMCSAGGCPMAGTLTFRDGTIYYFYNGVVTWIKDRNGNKTTIEHAVGLRVSSVTDSLGRVTSITYDNPGSGGETYDLISFKGASGADRNIKIYKGSLSSALRPGSGYSVSAISTLFPNLSGGSSTHNPSDVVKSVELPNGKKYTFYYNQYEELARVDLPTGGSYEYDYGAGVQLDGTSQGLDFYSSGQIGPQPNPSTYYAGGSSPQLPIIYRRLLEKRTYVSSGSRVLREVFSRPESGKSVNNATQWAPAQVDSYVSITRFGATDSTTLQKSKHYHYDTAAARALAFPAFAFSKWKEGREYKTEELKPSDDSVLRAETRTFEQGTAITGWDYSPSRVGDFEPPINPRLKTSDSKLDSTTATSRSFTYDKYNNETLIEESGSSVPNTRRTKLEYAYTTASSYEAFDKNLISLVSRRLVYSGSESSPESETKYSYDDYALTTNVSLTGYDWPTNPTYRGNLTKISALVDSSVTPKVYLDTKMEYDNAGNVVKRTDPKSNQTTYSYASSCSSGPINTYAFLTKITNALSHETKIQYDCWLGKPDKVTDVNSKDTTASYNDTLDRLKLLSYPDGGSKSYDYDDSSLKVTETTDIYSCAVASSIVNVSTYDGLGRVVETKRTDGTGQITATNDYDGLGRIVKAHQPKRAADTDDYWTETTFDGLGRPVTVYSGCSSGTPCTVTTGVTATSYSYSGLSTTVTDPASKTRTTELDGLGRLYKVEEPGISPHTTYTYNLQGLLTAVSQETRPRSFTYDSLGRLTSATNPESGTTSYTYDDNGNLKKRTDARSVYVDHSYDALNRLTGKTYSTADTPTVTFEWDRTNYKGLLKKVSSSISATEYLTYDSMGRVTSSTQTTDGTAYPFSYTYNRAGLLESETYPSGRTVKSCYEAGGGIDSVTGTIGSPAVSLNYVADASYTSHGALMAMTVGTPAFAVTADYNTQHRQLIEQKVAKSTVTQWKQETFYCASGLSSCSTNNGNILRLKVTDLIGATPTTRTQDFTYDALNRLKTAAETGGYSQTYEYDRYGNRWLTPSSSLPGGTFQPTAASWYATTGANANTNQFTLTDGTYAYDAAGNMTQESISTSAWDAESRLRQTTIPYSTGLVITRHYYDGEGHRVKKLNQALGKTIYVFDAFGKLASEYPDQALSTCVTCYLFTDQVGSTRLVMDQNGVAVKRADFMPFGEEILSGATWANGRGSLYLDNSPVKQQFAGYFRNDEYEGNADFAEARFFRRSQGRFTSPDRPLVDQSARDPQSWNLYAYVRNNPLRFIDPTGMACVSGVHDQTGDACFETTVTPKKDNASPRGLLSGFLKNVANLFIGTYNASGDVAEQVDGIPNGQYSYHKISPFEYQSTAEDRGAVIAAGVTLFGTGLERLGLKAAEIGFSSRAVGAAAKELQAGATAVRVATKSEAEELFLRLYQGAGYRNSTGMSATEAKSFFGGKSGTYHWDTAAGHGPMNPHGTGPHLQVHTFEGPIVRIHYGPQN